MRWETIKSNDEQEIYYLFKGDEKLLKLIYTPASNSARVECKVEKRVFLIRKEGFRKSRTVIRNEYGIKMGEFGQENRKNFIEVNGEKVYYDTVNNPLAELRLFRDEANQPVVACGLEAKEGNAGIYFRKDKQLGEMPHPGLLMALCWYMFLPVARENIVEFSL